MTFLSEYVDGGPGCMRDDCMITESQTYQTMAYYPPVYDKNGINTNPDMNCNYINKRCLACGKGWAEVWQNGTKIKTL